MTTQTTNVIGFPPKQWTEPPEDFVKRLFYWDRMAGDAAGIPPGESDWAAAANYILELQEKIKCLIAK